MSSLIKTPDHNRKPRLGAILDPYHPLTQGLVGCWLFNEGGGNVAHNLAYVDRATLTNGPIWTPDGGVQTDDATNYVRILDPESRYSVDVFTLEIDLTINSFLGYDRIIEHKQDLNYNAPEGWIFRIYNTNTLIFDSSTSFDNSISYTFSLHERFSVALVKRGTVLHVYRDAVFMDSVEVGTVNSSTKALTIAYQQNNGKYTGLTVYRLRFWNRALSDGEILQAYEEPYGNVIDVNDCAVDNFNNFVSNQADSVVM